MEERNESNATGRQERDTVRDADDALMSEEQICDGERKPKADQRPPKARDRLQYRLEGFEDTDASMA